MIADLHLHSTFSDGTPHPLALALACRERGIEVIAVTDHDTWDQNEVLAAATLPAGLDFVPGVELSTSHEATGLGLHVLGYGLDPDAAFRQMLADLRRSRRNRVVAMGEALHALGITVDVVGILAEAGVPGKPDVARSALDARGNARRLAEDRVTGVGSFIRTYLEDGRPAHVPKHKVPTAEAVASIRRCGGHPVWAHPALDLRRYPRGERTALLGEIVAELVASGLEGLEVGNLAHTPEEVAMLGGEAARFGLRETAGSDFHDFEDKDTNRILTCCDQEIKWITDS